MKAWLAAWIVSKTVGEGAALLELGVALLECDDDEGGGTHELELEETLLELGSSQVLVLLVEGGGVQVVDGGGGGGGGDDVVWWVVGVGVGVGSGVQIGIQAVVVGGGGGGGEEVAGGASPPPLPSLYHQVPYSTPTDSSAKKSNSPRDMSRPA